MEIFDWCCKNPDLCVERMVRIIEHHSKSFVKLLQITSIKCICQQFKFKHLKEKQSTTKCNCYNVFWWCLLFMEYFHLAFSLSNDFSFSQTLLPLLIYPTTQKVVKNAALKKKEPTCVNIKKNVLFTQKGLLFFVWFQSKRVRLQDFHKCFLYVRP